MFNSSNHYASTIFSFSAFDSDEVEQFNPFGSGRPVRPNRFDGGFGDWGIFALPDFSAFQGIHLKHFIMFPTHVQTLFCLHFITSFYSSENNVHVMLPCQSAIRQIK